MSMNEVVSEAERLVFRHGGWLEVATKMGMTREALKRHFQVSGSVTDAREWLELLQAKLKA